MQILPATGGNGGHFYVAVREDGDLLFEVRDMDELAAIKKAEALVRTIEIGRCAEYTCRITCRHDEYLGHVPNCPVKDAGYTSA